MTSTRILPKRLSKQRGRGQVGLQGSSKEGARYSRGVRVIHCALHAVHWHTETRKHVLEAGACAARDKRASKQASKQASRKASKKDSIARRPLCNAVHRVTGMLLNSVHPTRTIYSSSARPLEMHQIHFFAKGGLCFYFSASVAQCRSEQPQPGRQGGEFLSNTVDLAARRPERKGGGEEEAR